MSSSQSSTTELSLDDQRVLLHIRQSSERDGTNGRQVLDFSSLRDATGWSYDKTDGRVRSLISRGYLQKDYRDVSEMDTNRQPPRLFKLTEKALRHVRAGGITDAMVDEDQIHKDPLELQRVFERLNAVEELAGTKFDESIEESKQYYMKVSGEVDKLQESSREQTVQMDELNAQQSTLQRELELVRMDISRLTNDISEVQDYVSALSERVAGIEYRIGVLSRDRAEELGAPVKLIDAGKSWSDTE